MSHPRMKTAEASQELTTGRIVTLLIYSTVVWLAVAFYIRYGGPAGDFTGQKAISTYIATLLFTVPLNWFSRTLVGLPPEKMLQVAAVSAIVPPALEGVAMHWYPQLYGGNAEVIRQGAVFILFAIGCANGLALVTTLRANKRHRAGDDAPPIVTKSVVGATVIVPDPNGGLTHVQFLRFAGCPVCNLLLQPYVKRNAELQSAGIREVLFFHSEARFIEQYYAHHPIDVIADPHRRFYRQYSVERSPLAIMSPLALANLIRGYRLKAAGKQDSTPFGLPAEFLIDAMGRIVASHYGEHSSDQWSVDDVLQIARRHQRFLSPVEIQTEKVIA